MDIVGSYLMINIKEYWYIYMYDTIYDIIVIMAHNFKQLKPDQNILQHSIQLFDYFIHFDEKRNCW